MTKSKSKKTKKVKAPEVETDQVLEQDTKLESTDSPQKSGDMKRLTLMEAIKFVRELNGADFFEKLLSTLLDGKYIGVYKHFLEMYDKYNNHHNDISPEDLDAIVCLLIYVDCKSLPIYGSLEDKKIILRTPYLMSPLNWRKDFKEVLTLYTAYQTVRVDTSDLTYLF